MEFQDNWLASGRFNWNAGYGLASVCELSYRDPRQAANVASKLWGMKATGLRGGNTEAIVVEGERSVVVGFRGTAGLSDWMRNIDVGPRHSEAMRGRIHSGFLGAYLDAADLVQRALQGTEGKALWFTGHSLGGAIAVIAAAEYLAHRPSNIVTFGQPRMMKSDARAFMRTNFGDSYIRVVNDNDIVSRIPPNYGHTGQLMHFDFAGSLRRITEVLDDGDGGPPPLTEAQFNDLQSRLETLNDRETLGPSERELALEGIIPGVPAHRIQAYVQLMRTQARRNSSSGASEALASIRASRQSEPLAEALVGVENIGSRAAERYPAILRLIDTDWVAPPSLIVQSRFSNIATVLVTQEGLSELENDAAVGSVELSRDATGLKDLDKSVPFVGGDAVQRPPLNERGDGALVGIIDTGVDILHDAFLDAQGNSRILAIWDQTVTDKARTPNTLDPAAFTQTYGRVFLRSDIVQFQADQASGAPSHPSQMRDPDGHGTHVAGIAVGRASGSMADGMAPAAGVVCVIASVRQKPGDPPSLGYSMSHVDALAFLKRVSEGGTVVAEESKPMAVNVSLGMNAGAHDGTTTLETAFDGITGGGRIPGFVIVKSAGNERGHGGHARVSAFNGGIMPLEWESSTRFRNEDYFEGWFDGLDDMAFRVVDPDGNKSNQVTAQNPTVVELLGGNLIRLSLTENHPDNGCNRITLTVSADQTAIQNGVWTLEVEGRRIVSADGTLNIWLERNDDRPVRFKVEDPEMTLSIPGTARSVVCVGGSSASMPLRLLGASSWGLTRDGRAKPDLCAPGHHIVSARSGSGPTDTIAYPGTSMAAPHVTGALALVLSAQTKSGLPLSNAVQLQTALAKTVKGLPSGHNVGAGFGVLDAHALYGELVKPGA
ncbi:S8 family serine peptidase [Sulfitobacter pacificus]|uniref:S8 family serine peptidase n=1 Tax=Sulfitobacter pacificus TaxID=1499314 RepID=UPI00310AF6DF